MTEQTDFLQQAQLEMEGAWNAIDLAQETAVESIRMQMMALSKRRQRTAQTLALLSLATDIRRVADVLESRMDEQDISSAVRIWGSGNS